MAENRFTQVDGGKWVNVAEKATWREKWKIHLRPEDDDEDQDWWWASTAIPLFAATFGPLANVMSIAALVTSWRCQYDPKSPGVDADAIGFRDPTWCLCLNGISLAFGFFGNIFLLFNFTRRVRYIVALPMTIACWYLATGILIGITVSMDKYVPPKPPDQLYSQGYWHAVAAAALYMLCSMALMLNMLGYFFGHYPQHFDLSDEQRNLILQTMMFFIWLAGGGAIFARVEGWSFADALYFCDVTILTVGFGDFHPINDGGRGLVFPYSVGGIIILGLMVSSIHRFAHELGSAHVVQNHIEKRRNQTMNRSVANDDELIEVHLRLKTSRSDKRHNHRRLPLHGAASKDQERDDSKARSTTATAISRPLDTRSRVINFASSVDRVEFDNNVHAIVDMNDIGECSDSGTENQNAESVAATRTRSTRVSDYDDDEYREAGGPIRIGIRRLKRPFGPRLPKITMLKEEKDRFDAMRAIQKSTSAFKRYTALTMSIVAFGVLWCVGAIGFWKAEQHTQQLSYFQALYFCYVSLLTIGYGDLSPTSNAGKPLFIVWSLIAVPTMTILVSDMGETVIASFKRATFALADWTVLPRAGIWRDFCEAHPRLLHYLQRRQQKGEEKSRLARGFAIGPAEDDHAVAGVDLARSGESQGPTLEDIALLDRLDDNALARRLTVAIRRTAKNLGADPARQYSYEEWAEYTRLIRFSRMAHDEIAEAEEDGGMVEWDWIGKDSPMMADQSESEWILDRLTESLDRFLRKNQVGSQQHIDVRRRVSSKASDKAESLYGDEDKNDEDSRCRSRE